MRRRGEGYDVEFGERETAVVVFDAAAAASEDDLAAVSESSAASAAADDGRRSLLLRAGHAKPNTDHASSSLGGRPSSITSLKILKVKNLKDALLFIARTTNCIFNSRWRRLFYVALVLCVLTLGIVKYPNRPLGLLLYGRWLDPAEPAWAQRLQGEKQMLSAGSSAAGYGWCTLDSCFDFSRSGCLRNPFSLYVYPADAGWEGWLAKVGGDYYRARQKEFEARVVEVLSRDPSLELVERAEDACLLLPRIHLANHCDAWEGLGRLRLRALPHWNGSGANHVLLDKSDSAEHRVWADKALLAKVAFHVATRREGFDVQTLVSPRDEFMVGLKRAKRASPAAAAAWSQAATGSGTETELSQEDQAFLERPLLASFKGTNTWGTRVAMFNAVRGEADCKVLLQGHSSPEEYAGAQYADLLLTSRFSLAPRGLGLHSFRMTEALAAGAVPVVIADGYALPESDLLLQEGPTGSSIDWGQLVVRVAEHDVDKFAAILRAIPRERALEMHRKGAAAYERLRAAGAFDPVSGVVVIMRRVSSHLRGEAQASA